MQTRDGDGRRAARPGKKEAPPRFDRKKFFFQGAGDYLVLDNAPLAVFVIDGRGRYRYLNPVFEQTFGYTLKDIPTRRDWFRKAYPDPAYRRYVLSEWNLFLENQGVGIQYPISLRVRCRDGSDKWINFFRPVVLEGDLTLIFCHDFTAHHEAEEALRESRQQYRQIVETANEGIWVLDRRDRTVFVNPVLAEMLGYQPEEMGGLPVSRFIFREDLPDHRERLAVRHRGKRACYERRFRRKDGRGAWCLVSAAPLTDSRGSYAGAFGMLTDITRRRETESALRRSEEKFRSLSEKLIQAQENERKRIAVELHDEIGQSLIGLKFQLVNFSRKWLRGQKPLPGEIDQLTRTIDEMTASVRRLSRDLRPAVLEHLGLREALQWLLEDFSQKSGMAIRYRTALPLMGFSREREIAIFRIFQEALTNIGKHSRATRISVSVVKNRDEGVFSISDNGTGFKLREIGRRPLAEKGLGLTAMQERAQLAGGVLEIRSTGGKGTRITFHVPFR